jgi:N-acetylglutamate synthase-like GNAT family acetyltransferase
MTIRPAVPQDLEGIQRVLSACDLDISGVDYSRWDGIILVAETDQQVVGFIHAVPTRPVSFITVLGVLPAYQKVHVGTELLKGVELLLRSLGVTVWWTFVGDSHEKALAGIDKWEGIVPGGSGQTFVRRF